MKDCKAHYIEMVHVRMGEVPCPFCDNQRLRDDKEALQIHIRELADLLGEALEVEVE